MKRADHEAAQARAELACEQYLVFLAVTCLIASLYIGWPVFMAWLLTWWSLRQFCAALRNRWPLKNTGRRFHAHET